MGVGSLVPLVSNTLLINPKKSPKSTKKARDFPLFCDYIYDKGNMTKVIGR
jgi:hypothetical protein